MHILRGLLGLYGGYVHGLRGAVSACGGETQLIDWLMYIIAGGVVGFAVGMTGVGGGSLMTPLLLLFGFPAHIAIGTDLLYAGITKSGGVLLHQKERTVQWPIVTLLLSGSLPASVLTAVMLKYYFPNPESYSHILTSSLGVMLILTSLVLLYKPRLKTMRRPRLFAALERKNAAVTWLMGVALGVLVTLSSVGAGAFGAAILLMLYPQLKSLQIIGTDLAHAVPLTLIAGVAHIYLGNVDFQLLAALLMGSLPCIWMGTHLSKRLPEKLMQPLLGSILLGLGCKYAFF